MTAFRHLLEPRSVAVVGVSDEAGRPGSQAVRALRANGYAGRIFPVNPKYADFEGLRCYPSIAAIEEEIDLAIIGVPAQAAVAVVESCALRHVPFALVFSGGFREAGPEGIQRERQMVAAGRAGGTRILGPNCLGFANIHAGVYAAFGSITRPPRLIRGNVSLVTQSGGFGYSIALACAEAGIGFRHVIATGNESDITSVELIGALVDDPETHTIVAYLEGTDDGRALLEVGRKALAAGKPLLLWKGGVTSEGARAAASHTASMTGSYDFYRALFKQSGIVEVRELHDIVDYLAAFEARKYPRGRGVAVMGVSGGSAIVFADAGEPAGLHLCDFAEATRARLRMVVPQIGAVTNPVDLTAGYFSGANRAKLEAAVAAVLDDPDAASVCVNIATTGGAGSKVAAEVLAKVAAETERPVVVFSSTPASENAEARNLLAAARIPVLPSPSRAARALAVLATYREARERLLPAATALAPEVPATPDEELLRIARTRTACSEAESKAILARAGVAVTRDLLVQGPSEAALLKAGGPFVVKIVSPDIAHKTEAGGVQVGLRNTAELEAAIAEVTANARRHAPRARIDGVMVSEMVSGGFELLAGVVNDVVFGPVVVVGAGGIHAEILRDTACRIAPFDEATARAMIDELRCRPVLDGARGRPPLDVGAAAATLAALSRFAWQHRDQVREIDVNPLFVLPEGAVAADALIVLADPASLGRPEAA